MDEREHRGEAREPEQDHSQQKHVECLLLLFRTRRSAEAEAARERSDQRRDDGRRRTARCESFAARAEGMQRAIVGTPWAGSTSWVRRTLWFAYGCVALNRRRAAFMLET